MAVLPKWVSDSLENALRKYFTNEDVQILEYKNSLAIPVGENYTTDIFRTSVTYTTTTRAQNGKKNETISVIIKCSSDNELLINYDKLMGLFDQEIDVYTKVLPALNNILGDREILSAKCIFSIKDPHPAIILEDLTTLNFKTQPRQEGLDLQHCLLAIEKLAHFHAGSAVLYEKNPELINKYEKGIYWDNPFTQRWLKTGFRALIEACVKWPGFQKYSKKLESIEEQAVEKTFSAGERKLEEFNVLNHGDFWINNFMYSYTSSGKLKDCRFVDFQVVLHSSPAIDLNYFWATSPNVEVRKCHLDTILDHYFKELSETLTKLQYPLLKMPDKSHFRKDLDSRAFYGLAAAVTVLPFVAASNRSDASFEDLFENESQDGFRHDAYNNERYRKYMEYLLPLYDNLGILN